MQLRTKKERIYSTQAIVYDLVFGDLVFNE